MKTVIGVLLVLLSGAALGEDAAALEKSCVKNVFWACNNLGVQYDRGEGVQQDKFRAFELYTKACDGGFAGGCFNLGLTYYNIFGQEVVKDDFKAFELFKKACDGELASGCEYLGRMYDVGQGVRLDKSKALGLYGKACDLKDAQGCRNYARLKNQGVR